MVGMSAATEGQRLSPRQQATLLHIAREAVECAALGRRPPAPDESAVSDPALWELRAVFVTLRLRDGRHSEEEAHAGVGQLRGCIGQIEAAEPLLYAVQEAAFRAATIDPRFPPVQPYELNDITIDISILSAFRPVASLAEIEVGRDGLFVMGGGKRGLLLPQVATMYELDAAQFVANTCLKAGLPPDAWPGAADLFAFTTTTVAEAGGD